MQYAVVYASPFLLNIYAFMDRLYHKYSRGHVIAGIEECKGNGKTYKLHEQHEEYGVCHHELCG